MLARDAEPASRAWIEHKEIAFVRAVLRGRADVEYFVPCGDQDGECPPVNVSRLRPRPG